MKSIFQLLSTVSLLKVGVIEADSNNTSTWPDPEPCSGNCSAIHDPSVVRRADGTWFRFSTNGNIAIASAPNLTGPWEYQGAMLPNGSEIQVIENQEIWAPDVFLVDDTYYAYYAVSLVGLQTSDIGLATSDTLEAGTWTDQGSLGLPKSNSYNLIDPNLFRESSTAPFFMSFGSAWNGIYQTQLSSPPDSESDSNGTSPNNIAYNSTHPVNGSGPAIVEGSFQFWWLQGGTKYYYLFFSSGACCNLPGNLAAPGDEYKIMVCRATSPTGPFSDQAGKSCLDGNGGTLVLGSHGENVYAPGGQGVIFDEDAGRIALYYHYVNPQIGYAFNDFQFGFNYLDLSSGWPVVVS
ncbi:hypothetical protein PV05_00729 [Exophiala xenobiotica]|uniref:Arabinan endo-1,5-alpha-L-arabinosidase n=1 Tax=Exophiala xenobiotica TaxID=348802 RepID=A0A0D2DE28_9EURO|nr:uncharacterized protein PV05_00729 [Exophiala xenobiotica]KIW60517.1 hypothetical protein PV05_00729 [Exophiala xenobiotica]